LSQVDKELNGGAGGEPGQSVVYEISDVGFTDGIEIKQLIHLLEVQNNEGVNDALNLKDAGTTGAILRNAMLSRLVLLVSRVYGTSREQDIHVARAFDLLKDPAVKAEMAARISKSGNRNLAKAEERSSPAQDQTIPRQVYGSPREAKA
jgi:hypothetical protein